MSDTHARPFTKWAGGKRTLLPTILEVAPVYIGNYFEPFVGGGAVFFGLMAEQVITKRAYLNDINSELINAYVTVCDHTDALVRRLKAHAKKHCEEHYYAVRAKDRWNMEPVDDAARFLYLNRTCFNGLYRVNREGNFNVPFGKYANPTICDEGNIRSCASVLKLAKTKFGNIDFEAFVKKAKEGDFVYFDPPYMPRVGNEFVRYDSSAFGLTEHTRLRDCARTLKKIGVNVMISNSGADEVRELYKRGFKIREVDGIRTVGAAAHTRGTMPDVLIT